MKGQTISKMNEFMEKLHEWNLLKGLTQSEIEGIKYDLQNIAATAVMESQNRIHDILPEFYDEITKRK